MSEPPDLREAHRRQLTLLDECLAAIAAHSAVIERTGAVTLTTTSNARALAIAGTIGYLFEISKSCAVRPSAALSHCNTRNRYSTIATRRNIGYLMARTERQKGLTDEGRRRVYL